ncbi:GntR family transcriptional regulator [Streptomyces sp. NPDC001177]
MPEQSFTPQYYRIEQEMRARIARMAAGEPLPSDAELCEEFGVSRMTARHAMQRLVDEGLVSREPGRGSFVAHRRVDRELSHLVSFSQEIRSRGMNPSSKLIDAGLRPARSEEARLLHLDEGQEVVAVTRVRAADEEPMAIEHATLTDRCAQVLEKDLGAVSLHATLRALGIIPTSGRSIISAQLATAEDAKHLKVARRSPVLVEKRLIFDASGDPIECTESRYVPDRYVLETAFTVETTASQGGSSVEQPRRRSPRQARRTSMKPAT